MKFLGNYKNWIKDEWIEELLTSDGIPRPSGGDLPDTPEAELQYQIARDAGYKDSDTYFYMFNKDNVSFAIDDIPFSNKQFHWWITKMLPGNFMPMHRDPHTLYERDSNRFWIPLQDWEPGHIFMYENVVITNYKKGDVYQYDTPNGLHGAANIGFVPRVVLQISTYS